MRPPPRLSNVYTPTVLPHDDTDRLWRQQQQQQQRRQERASHELRRVSLQSGVIRDAAAASGSALVQLGNTQVLCTVLGPVTSSSPRVPNHVTLNMDEGVLHVDVQYSPALAGTTESHWQAASVTSIDPTTEHNNSVHRNVYSRMIHCETDLAVRVASALQAAVPLRPYPKCAICVQLTVLQDDGGVLPVCVTAAVAALANAKIELYDLVASCCVAVMRQPNNNNNDKDTWLLLADPTRAEMEMADCVVTLALLPNWKEVTLWEQMGGASSLETTNAAVNLCRDGCRTLHKFLREHLIEQETRAS